MSDVMRQVAPYPAALAALIAEVAYKPGWSFELADDCERHAGARGLTLVIRIETVNAYAPQEPYTVTHYRWVPAESYGPAAWARWLFDQCQLAELHEGMEFFRVGGERPFVAGHGGGADPYHAVAP